MSPEKATGSQETAPLPDHSQEISAVQSSPTVLPCLPPTPAPRPEVGREGPGCFISSSIVFQTMGKAPLSQTRDSPLHRPKLGQRRGKEGSLWGKKLSARPDDQRNPPQTEEGGEEGSKAKMCWVQTVRTTPGLTPAPNLRTEHGLKLRCTCQPVPAAGPAPSQSGSGCEAMAVHRLLTCRL